MKTLSTLVAPVQIDTFLCDYLFKKPLASQDTARELRPLFDWDILDKVIKSENNDCWLVQAGTVAQSSDAFKSGRMTLEQVCRAFADGKTLLARHAENADEGLKILANEFADFFNEAIDVQIYATPGGQNGFSWHYDIEDVFVIQTQGTKEFYLRPNTVLTSLKTSHMQGALFAKEKSSEILQCTLKAGDFLYIPAGWWHMARALTDSFHISVGVNFTSRMRDSG